MTRETSISMDHASRMDHKCTRSAGLNMNPDRRAVRTAVDRAAALTTYRTTADPDAGRRTGRGARTHNIHSAHSAHADTQEGEARLNPICATPHGRALRAIDKSSTAHTT